MTDGLLQAAKCSSSEGFANREVANLISETARRCADECGVITHTLRTMHRMQVGSIKTLGHPPDARGKIPRDLVIYHLDLRGRAFTAGWISGKVPFPKVHETAATALQT